MAETGRSPGWYPDPDSGPGERWWNGVGWSDTRRGVPTVTLAPPAPAQRVIYSAENPAPQAPGQAPVLPVRSLVTINSRVNPMATYGFIAGIIALFFNFLLVPSVLAIVFSLKGLTKAKQLQAAGQAQTLRNFALLGLGLGIVGAVLGLFPVVFFIIGVVSSISVSVSS